MFVNCNDAVNWITNRRSLSRGLENYCEVMKYLDNPQDKIKAIHVAGTNGKGSTCSFLNSCLIEAGYKVGLFTSPHLVKHQDRIRVNNTWISDESFITILNKHLSDIERYGLNMFEIDFLIACEYFIQEKVDIMIIEVGLGGRLDCTNCISKPLASCITSIGLDHTEFLGDTVEKIAFEKAGIMKKDGLCFVGDVKRSVLEVIEGEARNKNCFIVQTKQFQIVENSQFEVDGDVYSLSSMAKYQFKNATLAITILNECNRLNLLSCDLAQIKKGIKKSSWDGRFEVVSKNPMVVIDGAHNEEGINALLDSIQILPKPWIFVVSILNDKAVDKMLKLIQLKADKLIITQFDFYRAIDINHLQVDHGIEKCHDMTSALKNGIDLAMESKGSLIVCGSLYFISEARIYFKEVRGWKTI